MTVNIPQNVTMIVSEQAADYIDGLDKSQQGKDLGVVAVRNDKRQLAVSTTNPNWKTFAKNYVAAYGSKISEYGDKYKGADIFTLYNLAKASLGKTPDKFTFRVAIPKAQLADVVTTFSQIITPPIPTDITDFDTYFSNTNRYRKEEGQGAAVDWYWLDLDYSRITDAQLTDLKGKFSSPDAAVLGETLYTLVQAGVEVEQRAAVEAERLRLEGISQDITFEPTDTTQISVEDFKKYCTQIDDSFQATVLDATYNCIKDVLGEDGTITVGELWAYQTWLKQDHSSLFEGLEKAAQGKFIEFKKAYPTLTAPQSWAEDKVVSLSHEYPAYVPAFVENQIATYKYQTSNYGAVKNAKIDALAAIQRLIEYIGVGKYQTNEFHITDPDAGADAAYTAVITPRSEGGYYYDVRDDSGAVVDVEQDAEPSDRVDSAFNKFLDEQAFTARTNEIKGLYGEVSVQDFDGRGGINTYLRNNQQDWAEKNQALTAELKKMGSHKDGWLTDDEADAFATKNESAQGVIEGFKEWKSQISWVISFQTINTPSEGGQAVRADWRVCVADMESAAEGESIIRGGSGDWGSYQEQALKEVAQFLIDKAERETEAE